MGKTGSAGFEPLFEHKYSLHFPANSARQTDSAEFRSQHVNTQLDQPVKWDHAVRDCPLLSEERKYKHFDLYLADSGEGAVGSIRAILVREPPAAKTIHGVGGDGVAELLEGVVPVPALFDLMEQFGQLTCHSIIWKERLGKVKNATRCLRERS